MTGPVDQADALRRDVSARLDDLVGALSDDADPGKVHVGWFAAADVAGCPARFRAQGADGWAFPGWAPQTAAASVGRSALARYLDRNVTAHGPLPALPDPLGAVKTWMREVRGTPTSPIGEWITHLSVTGDRIGLAATAGLAARWIAGFVRVMAWPLPERLAMVVDDPDTPSARRPPPPWRPRLATRRVPVTVASKPDAVAGTVAPSGQFDLLFHRPTTGDEAALSDRAAFEAAAGALAIGIVPASVVVTTADTGERLRFPVVDAVLQRGADQAVDVVRQRLKASADPEDWADATPSAACRHCPAQADCPPGQAWLARPGRRHNGLPVVGVGVSA